MYLRELWINHSDCLKRPTQPGLVLERPEDSKAKQRISRADQQFDQQHRLHIGQPRPVDAEIDLVSGMNCEVTCIQWGNC